MLNKPTHLYSKHINIAPRSASADSLFFYFEYFFFSSNVQLINGVVKREMRDTFSADLLLCLLLFNQNSFVLILCSLGA